MTRNDTLVWDSFSVVVTWLQIKFSKNLLSRVYDDDDVFLVMLLLTIKWSEYGAMVLKCDYSLCARKSHTKFMGGAFEILSSYRTLKHTTTRIDRSTAKAKTKFNLHFILIILCTCVRICADIYCAEHHQQCLAWIYVLVSFKCKKLWRCAKKFVFYMYREHWIWRKIIILCVCVFLCKYLLGKCFQLYFICKKIYV